MLSEFENLFGLQSCKSGVLFCNLSNQRFRRAHAGVFVLLYRMKSHSPPAKRTCVRPPLGELSPNVRFNRLEEETEQDKQTRRVAEAKDKNARARQRARKRGDILTPTPPERVKQFEQPEQLCSRCHCPRSPNQFRSSQQESPAAATTTCQECQRTKNRVCDNPLQMPVRTPLNSQSTPSGSQVAVRTSFDSQSTPSVSQAAVRNNSKPVRTSFDSQSTLRRAS